MERIKSLNRSFFQHFSGIEFLPKHMYFPVLKFREIFQLSNKSSFLKHTNRIWFSCLHKQIERVCVLLIRFPLNPMNILSNIKCRWHNIHCETLIFAHFFPHLMLLLLLSSLSIFFWSFSGFFISMDSGKREKK